MYQVEIEKNIPIPDAKASYGRSKGSTNTIWSKMTVGDSVFFPDIDGKNASRITPSQAHTWAKKQKSNAKFSARKVEGGVRIWRIA